MEDKIFTKPIKKQFEFDEEVASVFDDMIVRSVPFYKKNMALVRDLVIANTQAYDRIYDLGCSTGTLLIDIYNKSPHPLELIGIDSAEAMIVRARKKAAAFGATICFIQGDIVQYPLQQAQAIVSNYTLQFIRPLRRKEVVQKIYDALVPGGLFLFSEKIISTDKCLNKQLIDIYHNFKRSQGYSEYEIAQKREALENVLIPYSLEENMQLVQDVGFTFVEPIFRWANFATFFARK